MLISIAVPCHNEAESLPAYVAAMRAVGETIAQAHPGTSLELVLVDDGSTDTTLATMKRLAADAANVSTPNPLCIRWVSFSRNFGKEAAIMAGLERTHGELVATMDADLQDPPELLPRMLDMLLDAHGELDCVAARRATRAGEPRLRSAASSAFYGVMRKLTRMDIADGARDFRLMTRQMVDAVLALPERNRFSKGIFAWVGFRTEWVAFENRERAAGRSSWNIRQLAAYAADGIMAFSAVPLAIASVAGILLALASGAALIFIVVRVRCCSAMQCPAGPRSPVSSSSSGACSSWTWVSSASTWQRHTRKPSSGLITSSAQAATPTRTPCSIAIRAVASRRAGYNDEIGTTPLPCTSRHDSATRKGHDHDRHLTCKRPRGIPSQTPARPCIPAPESRRH